MAATRDRTVADRQQGDIVSYTGNSGYNYYEGCLLMKGASGPIIQPAVVGAGSSNARFLGVNANRLDLTNGTSVGILNVFKTGIFTFIAQGTGASGDIGLRAYAIDDQTVGISAAAQSLFIGEITQIPDSSTYRVRIDAAVNAGLNYINGLSGFNVMN